MADYLVVEKTSLWPDPDETSPAVRTLEINDRLSGLRQLGPWLKASVSAADGNAYLGWTRLDAIKLSQAKQFSLYDQPEGQKKLITGEITIARLQLLQWRKVDILLPDGSVATGWITSEDAAAVPDAPPLSSGRLRMALREAHSIWDPTRSTETICSKRRPGLTSTLRRSRR